MAAEIHPFYRLLLNKWYVDELYEKTVIKPLRSLSAFLWKGIDVVVIDGLVNSTAAFFMKLRGHIEIVPDRLCPTVCGILSGGGVHPGRLLHVHPLIDDGRCQSMDFNGDNL